MGIGRRGFFQLVGLGAVGSLAPIPLFGVGQASTVSSLLDGHLVVGGGSVDGTAHAVRGGDDPAADVLFRSREARAASAPTIHRHAVEDTSVARHESFGAGRVRLDVDPLLCFSKTVEIADDEDPLLRFYAVARQMREDIRDEAVKALARWHEEKRRGVQIVTVVDTPLSGAVRGALWPPDGIRPSRASLTVAAGYQHWLVRGEVDARDVYSTSGEYPLDDALDVERLVWIDERVRDGRIFLPS